MHPIQVAKYATAQGIEHEPTFNSWVHYVLKKRDRTICSAQYLKRIHKFGIELSKMVKEDITISKKNGKVTGRIP